MRKTHHGLQSKPEASYEASLDNNPKHSCAKISKKEREEPIGVGALAAANHVRFVQ